MGYDNAAKVVFLIYSPKKEKPLLIWTITFVFTRKKNMDNNIGTANTNYPVSSEILFHGRNHEFI